MAYVWSVNVGEQLPTAHSDVGATGIDKRPVAEGAQLRVPGPRGEVTLTTASGLEGDAVCDVRHHGGADQAVYAYARADLDAWADDLGRELVSGAFGENLTTCGIELSEALIGDRWQVGHDALLEVSVPRIPCRTFAGWLGERGWVRRFTERGISGTYLRVCEPGRVGPNDPISVVHRPLHGVTVGLVFRALTNEPELLPHIVDVAELPDKERAKAARRTPRPSD